MPKQELTDAAFKAEVLDTKDTPVLVDFWATWCGPCQMQGPIIDQLADEYAGKAKIAGMDVDQNPTTPGTYGIMSIPTLVIFKNGQVVEQMVGLHQKEQIAAAIDKAIG